MTAAGGVYTFLFSDIEGSTALLEAEGEEKYAELLAGHRDALRSCFAAQGGDEQGTEGDSFFVVFTRPDAAIRAAVKAQRVLRSAQSPVRVRIGIHTGPATTAGGEFIGLAVHHAARVMAAAHGGQILVSEAAAMHLPEEVDGTTLRCLGRFRLKDLSLPQRLYQACGEGLTATFPPIRTLEVRPHNLPAQTTPLIGRENDVAAVVKRLASDRLVTLVGTGGVGKTRMAVEVGARVIDRFSDGVWFVDLSRLTPGVSVLPAIARVLGVDEEGIDPVVAAAGSPRLLIMDNCEHVATAAAEVVSEMLARCRELKVLATSREALALAGEHLVRVTPLPVPAAAEDATDVFASASVRLLVERVAAVRPEYEPSSAEVADLAAICRQLDGVPLALELAAARFNVLSARQVRDRLDDRFKLLTTGPRDADARQRTLEMAIAWSYDLLDDAEKGVLRRMSVFGSSCDLDAAEAVTGADGIEPGDVVDVLDRLESKSLLVTDHSGPEPRYALLESIRAFAARLLETAEKMSARRRLLVHYLDVAKRVEPLLVRHEQIEWLPRLSEERPNLRVALQTAAGDPGLAALGLRLLLATWPSWRRVRTESYTWLDRLFDADADLPAALRADALTRSTERLDDPNEALTLIDEALLEARRGDDLHVLGRALVSSLMIRTFSGGAADEAKALAGELTDLAARLDDAPLAAEAVAARAFARLMTGDMRAIAEISMARDAAVACGHAELAAGMATMLRGVGHGQVEPADADEDDLSYEEIGARIDHSLSRSDVAEAERWLERLASDPETPPGRIALFRHGLAMVAAVVAGDRAGAAESADELLGVNPAYGTTKWEEGVAAGWVIDAMIDVGDLERVHRALDAISGYEGMPDLARLGALSRRIEVHLLGGDIEAARATVDALSVLAADLEAPVPLHRGNADVRLCEGDSGGALPYLVHAARAWLDSGMGHVNLAGAPGLALALVAREPELAAQLLGAAEVGAELFRPLRGLSLRYVEQAGVEARARLGDREFANQIAAGRAADPKELIEVVVGRYSDATAL